ncbi:hypothetical protein K8Z61_13930 [Nocardioides sp. TRM66260-LWL]|uniref:hypothetical protein n=1 Tax=Nocardioides sp. TRM66260-LWL TaxID=2874478 RepID=UPI001CC3560B|nr:hypothetical protein [Nocardioides sp. TRM66260-LWL]MBZ5735592.1 hypothetical protein [Nocardioides sp. TRM66260-LWL]
MKSESTWNIRPRVVGVGAWFDVLPDRVVHGEVAARFAVELMPLLAGNMWSEALEHAVPDPYAKVHAVPRRGSEHSFGRLVCPMAIGETRKDAWSADLTEETWSVFVDRVRGGQTWSDASVFSGGGEERLLAHLEMRRSGSLLIFDDCATLFASAPVTLDRSDEEMDQIASEALGRLKGVTASLPIEPMYASVDCDSQDGRTSVEAVLPYTMSWEPALLRGYSWASYVNAAVVERVGGRAVLEESGAFWSIEDGPFEGGLWVQACERHSEYSRVQAARLFDVLAPALLGGEPDICTTRPDALVMMRDAASHPRHPEHATWLAAQEAQPAPGAG